MKYVVNVYGRTNTTENSIITTGSEDFCNRLRTALKNKFPEDDFHVTFIDMDASDNLTDHDENLIEQIDNGDLPVALVTINDEIAVHGDIDVDTIVEWLVLKNR